MSVKRMRLFVGAFLATFLWGSAFPCVKMGYGWLGIAAEDTGSQMVFAGLRFFFAGFIVLAVRSIGKCVAGRWLSYSGKAAAERRVRMTGKQMPEREMPSGAWKLLLALALTQTFLQYFFYYIGLAHVSGTKGSIMNSMGTLFTVVFGMLYFKNKPDMCKILGVAVGMAGVLTACFSGIGGAISLRGEGALFLSAVFIAVGNIINKKASEKLEPMLVTGCHLGIGGFLLLLVGIIMGGSIHIGDWKMTLLLAYMVFISAAGFGIWSYLLRHNPVEQVAVFMFLTPVFGTILSGIVLGDSLGLPVLAALGMVCAGIVMVQRE